VLVTALLFRKTYKHPKNDETLVSSMPWRKELIFMAMLIPILGTVAKAYFTPTSVEVNENARIEYYRTLPLREPTIELSSFRRRP
jgi:hypothetical protein